MRHQCEQLTVTRIKYLATLKILTKKEVRTKSLQYVALFNKQNNLKHVLYAPEKFTIRYIIMNGGTK